MLQGSFTAAPCAQVQARVGGRRCISRLPAAAAARVRQCLQSHPCLSCAHRQRYPCAEYGRRRVQPSLHTKRIGRWKRSVEESCRAKRHTKKSSSGRAQQSGHSCGGHASAKEVAAAPNVAPETHLLSLLSSATHMKSAQRAWRPPSSYSRSFSCTTV